MYCLSKVLVTLDQSWLSRTQPTPLPCSSVQPGCSLTLGQYNYAYTKLYNTMIIVLQQLALYSATFLLHRLFDYAARIETSIFSTIQSGVSYSSDIALPSVYVMLVSRCVPRTLVEKLAPQPLLRMSSRTSLRRARKKSHHGHSNLV